MQVFIQLCWNAYRFIEIQRMWNYRLIKAHILLERRLLNSALWAFINVRIKYLKEILVGVKQT